MRRRFLLATGGDDLIDLTAGDHQRVIATSQAIETHLSTLRRTPLLIGAIAEHPREEQLRARLRPNDWSLVELLAHLQACAEAAGYSVVRELGGHGIGKAMHEPPSVPNHGRPDAGPRLRAGMVLALEPIVNAGQSGVHLLRDGWTVVTSDGSLSAHVEHTIAITDDGPEVLTLVPTAEPAGAAL